MNNKGVAGFAVVGIVALAGLGAYLIHNVWHLL